MKSFKLSRLSVQTIDFEALQTHANADPIGVLEACLKHHASVRKGIRRINWEEAVSCYAVALAIKNRPDEIKSLLGHKLFQRRKYKVNQSKLLLLAMLVGSDADTKGNTYRRASEKSVCLQRFFDRDVPASKVFKAIVTAKGFKNLRSRSERSTSGVASPGTVPSRKRHPRSNPREPDVQRRYGRDCQILELVARPKIMHQIMSEEFDKALSLRIRRVNSASDWKEFEVIRVKSASSK